MMSQIEHFAVYAEDPIDLKDFYVGAFGMRVIVENAGPPPAFFLADDKGMALEIIARPAGETNANRAGFAISRSGSTTSCPPAISSSGWEWSSKNETLVENDEVKTGFFKDPAGNRCQIVWRHTRLGG